MSGYTPWPEPTGRLVLPDGRSADRVDHAWSARSPDRSVRVVRKGTAYGSYRSRRVDVVSLAPLAA